MFKDFWKICKDNGAVGAWLCLLTSISLLIGSALCPPLFIIDSSILAAVGELFAFATLWKLPNLIASIQDGKSLLLKRGENEIEVKSTARDNNPRNPINS